MSDWIYFGLCLASWVAGAIGANAFSPLLGDTYAQATIPTVIAFSIGKVITRSNMRTLRSVIALPIITLLSGLIGGSIGMALSMSNEHGTNFSPAIEIGIALIASYALFKLEYVFAKHIDSSHTIQPTSTVDGTNREIPNVQDSQLVTAVNWPKSGSSTDARLPDVPVTSVAADEAAWAMALTEVDGPTRRLGLWAKCFSSAKGAEAEAKALYLRERVEQFIEEGRTTEAERQYEKAQEAAARATIENEYSVSGCVAKLAALGYRVTRARNGGWELTGASGAPVFANTADRLKALTLEYERRANVDPGA